MPIRKQPTPRTHRAVFPSPVTKVPSKRVLMGPDFVRVGLEGVDVDHPTEDLLDPAAAGLPAGVLGGDGAGEAEFLPVDLGGGDAARRQAEIHVFVPAGAGERDAFV